MPVQGSLKDLSVLEMLQLVGAQRKTVTLKLEANAREFHLHFRDGQLVATHRRSGGAGEPYIDVLIGLGAITPGDAISLNEQVRDQGRDLWTVTLDLPQLGRALCEQAYMKATEAILDRALLWDQGHFSMLAAAPVEPAFTPGLAIEALLVDAMRRLDELAEWKRGPLPESSVPCLGTGEESFVASSPLRRAIVRQIDGRRTIAQIVEAVRLGEHDVYEAITEGMSAGVLQLLGERKAPPQPHPGEGLGRSLVFALLMLLLALGLGTSWAARHLAVDRSEWTEARTRWQEVDLRRMIEVYRYRHGAYPGELDALAEEGLPVPQDASEHWTYQRDGDAYRLAHH